MKKWIAAILTLVMLTQALPWTAFADAIAAEQMISEKELQQALQIAGMRVVTEDCASENAVTGRNALMAAASNDSAAVRVEARESGYHPGMEPDETWDAQMLMDWLDDTLNRKIYNVINVFSRAEVILERMRDEDPEAYARYTGNAEFLDMCHRLAMEAEYAKVEAYMLRKRLGENTVVIENNTEMLANGADGLFAYEKARYSQQIREATDALEELRAEILVAFLKQVLVVITDQAIIDGVIEQEFSAWLKDVLDSEDGPKEATVSSRAVMSAAYNTRAFRMAAGERLLAADSVQDVSVQVITENDFAIVIRGVDNQPVGGVRVTVKDLNGNVERTLTTDGKFGSAVFNANDFVCDYDKMMEVSLTVDASGQGYRSFHIPWMLMKRGGNRTETLTLLTGPETKADHEAKSAGEKTDRAIYAAQTVDARPYIYSCIFNGYDIVHQDKETSISSANDAKQSFEVEVDHPSGASPKAPELHCYVNMTSGKVTRTEDKTFKPTSTEKVSATRTKYIYKGAWRRDLAPEITVNKEDLTKDQRPYFLLPDTGEVVRTKLTPVRSKADKPIITGQEPRNPLNSVLEGGFGLNFTIPKIGGKLSLSLPFDKYLPKVACDPTGYVTVTFGSSLIKNPNVSTLWKNQEAEKYDKAMKEFQHATTLTQKKQQLGTAKQYYKSITDKSSIQTRVTFDVGYFMMFAGRGENQGDDGGSSWSLSGAVGGEVVLSADYTQQIQIGPVPLYLNINFSASCGVSFDGMFINFGFDRNGDLMFFNWSLARGITVNVRLALTITLGVGIKGIASVWVSATGALNIIVSLMTDQPTHIAVYLEASVSAGFEIFWIKYSKVVWQSPKVKIYANYDIDAMARFSLFAAYAEEESEDIPMNQLEPERYPSLAPEAKKVMENAENVKAGIKTAVVDGHTYVFYIGRSREKWDGMTRANINYFDPDTGDKGTVANSVDYAIRSRDDYAFDVMSNGSQVVVVGCCSDSFDENGYPIGNTTGTRHSYCYVQIFEYDNDFHGLVPTLYDSKLSFYSMMPTQPTTGYNILLNPHIDSMTGNPKMDEYDLFFTGSCDGLYDATGERGCVNFQWNNSSRFYLRSDITVKSAQGDDYERVQVRSTFAKKDILTTSEHSSTGSAQSPGFVALSKPRDGAEGSDAIEFFDYYMNVAPIKVKSDSSDKRNIRRMILSTERKAIALAVGDIDHMEMTQHLDSEGEVDLWTVFYTQAETAGERIDYRLRSLEFQPRKVQGVDNFKYDVTYRDYDLSMPNADFRAVTLGASQYLYWLSTVSREKESEPDIWRITGVYYDAVTNTISDEIVIAEFSLPDCAWNGRTYRSVPYEITLTETGTGYITAKPNTGETEGSAVVPMTLYSFPITLKPVATLKGASLMETTVCQGEMVATDLSVMNEGNMGIGSFDVELWLMEKGREKQKIETIHADCLYPDNSTLVLHINGKDQTVARGEAAFYRLKDFEYSPRQTEWNVKSQSKTFTIKNGANVSISDGSGNSNHVTTNVLVPGALGGYTGSIKIPSDWKGEKQLRLKLTKESTYSNWLAAAALARSNPELFAEASIQGEGLFAASDASSNAQALAELGIVKLDYALDENNGKLVLQNPERLYAAGSNGDAARFAAGDNSGDDESLRLYAAEIEAPEPVDINCQVHDIDVSHRLYDDYYGDERLEITISNYHNDGESIHLTCAMYLNDSETPEYISLPYDPTAMSAGKTTTIDMPLKTLFDPKTVQKARFVFSPRGVAETATVNNEFTIYPGGSIALHFTQSTWAEMTRDGQTTAYTGVIPAKEGETVTLRVDPVGGTKPYRYQWQVCNPVIGEWVDLRDGGTISGANTDALTLRNVKGEWDGRQARCVAADAGGETIISDPITLRVTQTGILEPDLPDTGDHSNLPLYLIIAALALMMMAILRKRRRAKN